jgi:hypothetical protein
VLHRLLETTPEELRSIRPEPTLDPSVPLLPMTSKAGETWARHYAHHTSAAAFAVVIR